MNVGAAVDVVGGAGDVSALGAAQELYEVGDVVDGAGTAGGSVGEEGGLAFGGELAGGDVGVDETRRDGVDGDAVRAELGIDRSRLAVGGDSAGGGLAAGVALFNRDHGGPVLCFQYLGAPPLDDRLTTPSMEYENTPIWYRSAAQYSWDCYLGPGRRGAMDVSPYAAPARAADLTGLPRTFLYGYQFDPLRDEGIDFAQRLLHANVPTDLVVYGGTFHASPLVPAASSDRIFANNMAALRRGVHGE